MAINNLSDINSFKISAIRIFNQHYEEFLHPLYILAYYIHPEYREGEKLVAQLRRFEARWPPFNLPYVTGMDIPKLWWSSFKNQPRHLAELAHRIFSINPTQAVRERNFSTLKWILGDRRMGLGLNKLEGMAKIRQYYMTNIRRELSFFGKELTEKNL
ncbi:hypothetical protein C2G38_2035800 [Gigaspora rosea]|uniref:HAT C-terminal dimerisation domain-containing protein n=1 Tax=Gigaspora rosea TaxID=44941 RepID=A0A397VKT3_9GLOM|nr:hypothetical protein C2G38_2035800 [Gigaspora rosea]